MEIGEAGPKPVSEVKFQKVVAALRVITAKSLGKQSGTDLVIVIFHDFTMLAFGEPKKIKFEYSCSNASVLENVLCVVHQYLPILVMQKRPGYLSYWNIQEGPKTMFDIRCEDMSVVDMKFLAHSSVRLAMLYETAKKEKTIVTYSFDLKLLTLDRIPALCVKACADPTASIIIPLQNVAAERPVYLILGRNKVEARFRNTFTVTEVPFHEYSPTAFCEISACSFLVADSGGSLYILNAENGVQFTYLGKVETVPTSITQIDGDIFFIGSNGGNSMFVSLLDSGITVYNVIEQFIPANSFSKFCEQTGSIYMTQGNRDCGILSFLKTGIQFLPQMEIEMRGACNVFGGFSDSVVVTTTEGKSFCIDIGGDEASERVVTLDNFIQDEETVSIIQRDRKSFVQVTPHDVRLVGTGIDIANIHFDSEIIWACHSKREIVILFADSAEIITYNLASIRQVFFERGDAVCAAVQGELLAVSFTSGEIRLYFPNGRVLSVGVSQTTFCNSMSFLSSSGRTVLAVASVDGCMRTFDIPELTEGVSFECGYFIHNAFELDEKTLFINSTSTRIWNAGGSSVPVLCPAHLKSCLVEQGGNGMARLALLLEDKLVIGTIKRSSNCSIEQRPCIVQPLLCSVHEDPLSLFFTMQRDDVFLVSAFILPSFGQIFQHVFPEREEITCLHYSKKLKLTFCGTASATDGQLLAIGSSFHKMKVLQSLAVKGSVFCMAEASSNELVLGGSCCVIRVKVELAASGLLTLEIVQIIQSSVIPRSLSSVGHLVVNFGVARSIDVLGQNADGNYYSLATTIVSSRIHSGFAGAPLSQSLCHLFTVEMADVGVSNRIGVWSMKIDETQQNAITIKKLTEMDLEGSVSSFSIVKPGFALLATRDGAMHVLVEYDRTKVHSMKKILRKMADVAGITIQDTAIVDMHALSLFEHLSPDMQSRILSKLKISREDVLSLMRGFTEHVSNLCSA